MQQPAYIYIYIYTYWGYLGMTEKNMVTTILSGRMFGYNIEIMENTMETILLG